MRAEVAAFAAQDRPRHRLEQRALGTRDGVAPQEVRSGGLLSPGSPRAGVEQRRQFRLSLVEIASRLVVDNDHIGPKSLEAPVLLRLQDLPDERQRGGASHIDEQDRQIAGDAVPPQSGLAQLVGRQDVSRRAEGAIREQHARCQPLEQERIVTGNRQVMQRALGMSPRERERAHGRTGFPILL